MQTSRQASKQADRQTITKHKKTKKRVKKKNQKNVNQNHQKFLGRGCGITSKLFEVGKGEKIYLELLTIIDFSQE